MAAAPGIGGAAPLWTPPHELVSQTVTLLCVLRDPTNPQVRTRPYVMDVGRVGLSSCCGGCCC